jgi:hypothetical protein
MSFSQLDYCQYLLSSPNNYTLTNLANHLKNVSHDTINRYLIKEDFSAEHLWENVKEDIKTSSDGAILFDDTVLDKRFSESIELVRRQYSGTEHRVLRGIGLVNCVYVNPELGLFWVIDYCPLKKNRLVDDTGGKEKYQSIENLTWEQIDEESGKLIKIRNFPKDKKVKLFRVIVSTNRTEYVATNDLTQESTSAVQKTCGTRWKIEEFHREIKQLTGIESCQCRQARIQRNHIACAILVWNHLKRVANLTRKTVYQLKAELLSSYLAEELKFPSIRMKLV